MGKLKQMSSQIKRTRAKLPEGVRVYKFLYEAITEANDGDNIIQYGRQGFVIETPDGTVQPQSLPKTLVNPTPAQKQLADIFNDEVVELTPEIIAEFDSLFSGKYDMWQGREFNPFHHPILHKIYMDSWGTNAGLTKIQNLRIAYEDHKTTEGRKYRRSLKRK